jgi:hypothetical protein
MRPRRSAASSYRFAANVAVLAHNAAGRFPRRVLLVFALRSAYIDAMPLAIPLDRRDCAGVEVRL